jgi:hypothetical protein
MNRNRIIVIIVALVVAISSVFFVLNNRIVSNLPSQTSSSTPIVSTSTSSSVPVFPHDITYTVDGKIDTSAWQEFKNEYAGFSVRAPKEDVVFGCYERFCNLARNGQPFLYIIAPTEAVGIPGMSIYAIKKNKGTTIDTWIDSYIISGKENISSLQKIKIQQYQALQFDALIPKEDGNTIIMQYTIYPLGYENNQDGIDRYLIISHTTSINSDKLFKVYNSYPYSYNPLFPKTFNDKALADIYKAIFDSLVIFPPTKK